MGETDDIRRLLDEGLTYYGLGRVDDALEVWRRVLLLDPANQRAREYIRFVQENWAPGQTEPAKTYRPDKGSDPTLEVAAFAAQTQDAAPAQTSPTLTESPPLAPAPPAPVAPAPASPPAWQTQPSYTPPARPILNASQWGDLFDISAKGSPAAPGPGRIDPVAPAPPPPAVPPAPAIFPAPPHLSPPILPPEPAFATMPPPPPPVPADVPAVDRILSSTLPARPAPQKPEPPSGSPPEAGAADQIPVPPALFPAEAPATPLPTAWSMVPKTEPRVRLEIPQPEPSAPLASPDPAVNPLPPGIPMLRPSRPPAVASIPPSALDLVAGPEPGAAVMAPTAVEPEKNLEQLVRGIKDLLDLDDFTGALELADKVLQQHPGEARTQRMREEAEQGLTSILTSKLGNLQAVPRVRISGDEIIWLNLDHRAGFVLSLVDGNMSYDEILSVCGLPQIEGLRILANLLQDKVIESK